VHAAETTGQIVHAGAAAVYCGDVRDLRRLVASERLPFPVVPAAVLHASAP